MDVCCIRKKFLSVIRRITDKLDFNSESFHVPLDEKGLGLDSISRLNLLIELEKEFAIEFPIDCWNSNVFENSNDVIGCLEKLLNKQKP